MPGPGYKRESNFVDCGVAQDYVGSDILQRRSMYMCSNTTEPKEYSRLVLVPVLVLMLVHSSTPSIGIQLRQQGPSLLRAGIVDSTRLSPSPGSVTPVVAESE